MYREIVTKAVIAKGKISDSGDIIVSINNDISKVLGCWIINHYYVSCFDNNKIYAKGKYDLHIWYGYNNDSDTGIHKQTIDYIQEFDLTIKSGESISSSNEFNASCVKYPTCSGLSINDEGKVVVKVDKELSLDVVGETKLKVQVDNANDGWDSGLDSINTDYLNRQ